MRPRYSAVTAPVPAGRRTDSDLKVFEILAAEQTRDVFDNSGCQKPQTRRADRGVDDDHDATPFNGGEAKAFRPGNVEVAFQRVLAASEFVRLSNQRSEIGRIIGYDRSDCLPGTEVFRT